jgi:hypothetical protein
MSGIWWVSGDNQDVGPLHYLQEIKIDVQVPDGNIAQLRGH